jgi:hypothetical protein
MAGVADRVEAVAEQRMAGVEDRMEAVAGIINQSSVMFFVACKTWKWREAICGE